MRKITLPKIAKTHPIAFWLAVIFHLVLLVGLIFSSVQQWELDQKKPKKTSKPAPKAITIDLKEIQQEKQRLVDIQTKKALKIKRDEKRLRVLEDERYKKQQKINRLKAKTKQEKKAKDLAEKKRKLAQQKTKEAEKQKKLAEQKTKEAEKQKKIAEQKTKEAEKNKKLAEQKTAEAEKQKKLAEEKKKIAQQKAVEAEKQKKLIEAQRKAQSQKFKKEQNKRALTKEIQTEEDQEREIAQEDILNELKANYINQISSRVNSQWRYQGAKDSWGCDVHILQDADGVVKSVNVASCNVDNTTRAKSFKDSIERAVYKASPLPGAPDTSVFDSEIIFRFRVN